MLLKANLITETTELSNANPTAKPPPEQMKTATPETADCANTPVSFRRRFRPSEHNPAL